MALTKAPEELLDKSLTSALTITTADNTTQLTLTSTDDDGSVGPRFDLKRDSASPAADDTLGQIRWLGEDSGGASLSYAHIATYISDATDGAEDGKFEIDTRIGGVSRSRLLMHSTSTVFNQDSVDVDFRVESNDNTHMLFIDAGNNRIGINDSAPQQLVDIYDATLPVIRLTNGRNEGVGSDYDLGKIEFFSNDTSGTGARVLTEINAIADAASAAPGGIFVIKTAATNSATAERVRIGNDGNLSITDGNLVVASGHGINFSATGDATGKDSELLDDYEEGSWTATISSGSVSGNQCQYTKVGNLVTLRGNLADITDNTTNADIIITGLPYTAGSNNRAVGTAMFRYFSKTNAMHMNAYLGQNDTTLSFYWSYNAASSPWEVVEYDDGTQANMDIMFTIQYITT